MGKPRLLFSHNGSVTSTSISPTAARPSINRPNVVAVGTIVWLGSEVMFFAGLFAIYFTLRSTSPGLWAAETAHLNVPYALTNTIDPRALSSFTCQFGVFAAERLQPRATGCEPGQVGHGRVVHPHLRPRRDLRRRPDLEYATLVSEGIAARVERLRLGVLPDHRLPRPARHGRPHRLPALIGRAFAVKNFGHKEATSAIVVSYYWHFVDVVWIGLFLVIYIIQ